MESAHQSYNSLENNNAPVALLFGASTKDLLRFREYLESLGCTVIVNNYLVRNYRYLFCFGDWLFVKAIFENIGSFLTNAVVISREYREDGIPSFVQEKAKVAWLGDDAMNDLQMRRVLESAVTGNNTELILYKERQKKQDNIPMLESDHGVNVVMQKRSNIKELNLQNTYDEHTEVRISNTISEIFLPTVAQKNTKTLTRFSRIQKLFILFCIFIILPTFWYIFSFSMAAGSLWFGTYSFGKGNTKMLTKASQFSMYWIKQSQFLLKYVSFPLELVHIYTPIRNQERLLILLFDLAETGEQSGIFLNESQILAKQLFMQSQQFVATTTPATLISRGQSILPKIHDKLGLVEAHITLLVREHQFPFSISYIQQKAVSLQKQISEYRTHIVTFQKLLALYTVGSGFGKEVTYLVLLQNSMELRPSGGFIGSVALVSLRDGRLSDIRIEDVYSIDGQLRGHVNPPQPVAELLNQEHWYLRDSNWSADFRQSGERAAWFYEKSTGKKVSGVVGVSLPFITTLLTATGPIYLSDYNDTISSENFFGKSFYYTKTNFFPGSSQKKDFLGSLLTALSIKLTQDEMSHPKQFITAVQQALSGKSLQFWFADPKILQLVSSYGWDGKYPTKNCVKSIGCVSDDFGLVEANVSVNKVNYFVTRDMRIDMNFQADGTTTYKMIIHWKNASTKGDSTGGGDYRSYSRIYFPVNTQIVSVAYDGKPVSFRNTSAQFPNVPFADFEERNDGDLVEQLAIVHDVLAGSANILELTFVKKESIKAGDSSYIYRFSLQKQSGVELMPYKIFLNYPPQWHITGSSEVTGGSYTIEGELQKPNEYVIEFLR